MYAIMFLDGYIVNAPEFKVTKIGRKYCSFTIRVNNGLTTDGAQMQIYYKCFCWEGDTYNHLSRFNISSNDRMTVMGKLSIKMNYKTVPYYNIYVQGIELISSQVANKIGKAEADYVPTVQVEQRAQSFNGQEEPINEEDNFDY